MFTQLEDLIVYDVHIKYGEGKIFKLENIDLYEDIRDAVAILTDKFEQDMKFVFWLAQFTPPAFSPQKHQ